MKRLLVLAASALLAASCSNTVVSTPSPSPLPPLTSSDLARALIKATDIGENWKQKAAAAPNTVQIGGKIGAGNITSPVASATSAFGQTDGPGFVSNSAFLVAGENIARAVMTAHTTSAAKKEWKQDREDGGSATFTYEGSMSGLETIGDQVFTARLSAKVTKGDSTTATREIGYVAFRKGAVVAFVVAQDTDAAPIARKLAHNLNVAMAAP